MKENAIICYNEVLQKARSLNPKLGPGMQVYNIILLIHIKTMISKYIRAVAGPGPDMFGYILIWTNNIVYPCLPGPNLDSRDLLLIDF